MGIKSIAFTTTAALFLSTGANAAYIFSDVSITSNAVTFTIDGDMTGYAAPNPTYSDYFGLRYYGDIYTGSTSDITGFNLWSTSVFDNKSISYAGNTGGWYTPPYTWSGYSLSDLTDSVATNRTVTLTVSNDFLDVKASGSIDFIWGWSPDGVNATVLHTENINAVPVPAAVWLFGSGLIGLVSFAKRKKA